MNKSIAFFILFVIAMACVPLGGNNYYVQQATFVCMYAALALSWNIIGGYTGYPSFATAAFIGLGAYVGAIVQNAGMPMVAAWVVATIFTGLFAALLGVGILRMKGHYFAVGSIAIVEILRLLSASWSSMTGGGEGLNVPILAGGPEFAGRVFLAAMLVVMILAFIMTVLVDRSRLGFGLRCIQQNEDAADMVGVDVVRYKVIAFTLSAVFCGTVGAIGASWTSYIDPSDSFSILTTLKVPVMVLLGGPGTLLGPVIGAATFVMVELFVWSRFLDFNRAALGVVILLLIFFLPGGIMPRLMRRRRSTTPTRDQAASSPGNAAGETP